MSLSEALLIALRALRAHRLRSALTMLGLVIGVAAWSCCPPAAKG